MARRRQRETLQVISWRDIPAQINAVSGGENYKALLSARFQHAIDRAAHVAGLTDHETYIREWRKDEFPVEADPAAQVEALAATYEADYPKDRLEALVKSGGAETSSPETSSPETSDTAESGSPA